VTFRYLSQDDLNNSIFHFPKLQSTPYLNTPDYTATYIEYLIL